jgi:hypothetical protein
VEFGDDKGKDENEQLLKGNATHVDVNPLIVSIFLASLASLIRLTSQDFLSCFIISGRSDRPSCLY